MTPLNTAFSPSHEQPRAPAAGSEPGLPPALHADIHCVCPAHCGCEGAEAGCLCGDGAATA